MVTISLENGDTITIEDNRSQEGLFGFGKKKKEKNKAKNHNHETDNAWKIIEDGVKQSAEYKNAINEYNKNYLSKINKIKKLFKTKYYPNILKTYNLKPEELSGELEDWFDVYDPEEDILNSICDGVKSGKAQMNIDLTYELCFEDGFQSMWDVEEFHGLKMYTLCDKMLNDLIAASKEVGSFNVSVGGDGDEGIIDLSFNMTVSLPTNIEIPNVLR